MVTVGDMDTGRVQQKPMDFPPEVKKLEERKQFKFAWLPFSSKDTDQLQRAQLTHAEGTGYYVAVRQSEFSTRLPRRLFGPLGGIQNGDCLLFAMRWDVWEASEKLRIKNARTAAERAQDGHDDDGEIGGRHLEHGASSDDSTDRTMPFVPGLTNEKGEEIAEIHY